MFYLLAQDATETATAYPELSSVTAIIAATYVVTQIVKYGLASVKHLNTIPTWIYAIAVSACLTLIARYALETIDGDVGPLLWTIGLGAATASGFQSWYSNFTAAPIDKKPARVSMLPMLAVCVLFIPGCLGGVPGPLVQSHVDIVQPSHMNYVESDPRLSPAEVAAYRTHWNSLEDAAKAASPAH